LAVLRVDGVYEKHLIKKNIKREYIIKDSPTFGAIFYIFVANYVNWYYNR